MPEEDVWVRWRFVKVWKIFWLGWDTWHVKNYGSFVHKIPLVCNIRLLLSFHLEQSWLLWSYLWQAVTMLLQPGWILTGSSYFKTVYPLTLAQCSLISCLRYLTLITLVEFVYIHQNVYWIHVIKFVVLIWFCFNSIWDYNILHKKDAGSI